MDVSIHEVEDSDGRSLIFETEFGLRRATVFPADWCTMSGAALLALSDRTPD